MRTITRLGVGLCVALTTAVAAVPVPPRSIDHDDHGAGVFDADPGGQLPAQRSAYDSYLPIVMTGVLDGCWYTEVDGKLDLGAPSGLYFEVGHELFVGTINGVRGSFKATYVLEAQWAPDITTGQEVWGRCQHQITPGSGRDGLHGLSGRLSFTDIVNGADISYRVTGLTRQP